MFTDRVGDFFGGAEEVVTFVGFSGLGYEDPAAMRAAAEAELAGYDPAVTIVNAGATAEGIGGVYEVARSLGFLTTGIVSSQAAKHAAQLSPHVQVVFYVEDENWGGRLLSGELTATSTLMVAVSTKIVAIGGGEVAREEVDEARTVGIPVVVVPADCNHEKAREKAWKMGQPEPTYFGGEVTS